MIDVLFDETTGDLYTRDGQRMCSLGEILPPDSGHMMPERGSDEDEELPRGYTGGAGLSETLIRRVTEFKLPESKRQIQDALWTMFEGGIHQTMTNTGSPKDQKYAADIMHAGIVTSLIDRSVANNMSVSDYIQLHLWGRNLIARSTTYQGDRLRDATILGRTLNPGVVDALRYSPEKRSSGGGFFGFLKK